jgi:hypothetical protein
VRHYRDEPLQDSTAEPTYSTLHSPFGMVEDPRVDRYQSNLACPVETRLDGKPLENAYQLDRVARA